MIIRSQLKQIIMDIQNIWKQVKSFKKDADSDDFSNILIKLGYKELAYQPTTNKEGSITRRKFLVLSPSSRTEVIVLGKNCNILSITSK